MLWRYANQMDTMTTLTAHEQAEFFPELSPKSYEALKDSINENGQINPIYVYNGKIVDGRHRYKICQELNLQPILKELTDDEANNLSTFILGANAQFRTDLNSSKRASIALKFLPQLEIEAKARQGGRTDKQTSDNNLTEEHGRATDIAAKLLRTNRDYITTLKKANENYPELIKLLNEDKISISGIKAIFKCSELDKKAVVDKVVENPEYIKQLKPTPQIRIKQQKKQSTLAIPDVLYFGDCVDRTDIESRLRSANLKRAWRLAGEGDSKTAAIMEQILVLLEKLQPDVIEVGSSVNSIKEIV